MTIPQSVPLPLSFELPEGWRPAEQAGGAMFVAVHPESANGFTANITLSEQDRTDAATLPEIADEALHRLESVAVDGVKVEHRSAVGSPEAPGFTQVVRFTTTATGELVQCQVLMSFEDTGDAGDAGAGSRQVVVEAALTATPEQLKALIQDFERFVATIRVDDAGR
ncbi:hypothetical protein [Actinophytocola sp.]|jgi:hypothetical protein|uniref:hypothetical protein n=1 Tax=Actinophytocola sp. TaxID=1872138 RepID=UPI002ED9060F